MNTLDKKSREAFIKAAPAFGIKVDLSKHSPDKFKFEYAKQMFEFWTIARSELLSQVELQCIAEDRPIQNTPVVIVGKKVGTVMASKTDPTAHLRQSLDPLREAFRKQTKGVKQVVDMVAGELAEIVEHGQNSGRLGGNDLRSGGQDHGKCKLYQSDNMSVRSVKPVSDSVVLRLVDELRNFAKTHSNIPFDRWANELEVSYSATYEDIYEQCCNLIDPFASIGQLPGSVVESLELLIEKFAQSLETVEGQRYLLKS